MCAAHQCDHANGRPPGQRLAVLLLLLLITVTSIAAVSAASACAQGCSTYGTCYEPFGRCDCPWNRTGPACTELHQGFCLHKEKVDTCNSGEPSLCLNACNGRGQCMGGFCHCKPGFYGADCSLSLGPDGKQEELLAGLGYQPSAKGPRVYVYELPPDFTVKRDLHMLDRPPMHLALYERVLTSGHRWTDGDTADYYFVPITSRELKKGGLLLTALQYVAAHWPWWNATAGHRHVLLAEGDVGTCEVPSAVRAFAANATWLQFWGLYGPHPMWQYLHRTNPAPCHVPGKDIVVPFMAMSSHDRFLVETPLRPNNPKPERNITFFFSGSVCGSGRYRVLPPNCTHYKQERYSGGVRQSVYINFHARPGWRVVTRTDDYARDYSRSRFCLAAPGGGWGKRGIVAALYGCIPVSATDYLYEAFEPELSWSHFGVRVPQADIPTLGDKLETMPAQEVEELQRRTACAAQHFHWSSNIGGIMQETGRFDAFATIMAILAVRLRQPGVPPDQLYAADSEFRDFVDCVPPRQLKGTSGSHLVSVPAAVEDSAPLCSMFISPMYSRYPDT